MDHHMICGLCFPLFLFVCFVCIIEIFVPRVSSLQSLTLGTSVLPCGLFEQNFRPLHDFWTFLFERLNKVLKSFKANNHANGELETTFFKEFHRTCEASRVVSR